MSTFSVTNVHIRWMIRWYLNVKVYNKCNPPLYVGVDPHALVIHWSGLWKKDIYSFALHVYGPSRVHPILISKPSILNSQANMLDIQGWMKVRVSILRRALSTLERRARQSGSRYGFDIDMKEGEVGDRVVTSLHMFLHELYNGIHVGSSRPHVHFPGSCSLFLSLKFRGSRQELENRVTER